MSGAAPSRARWTPEEDTIVREFYSRRGVHRALEFLPRRSEHAVHHRAKQLGICSRRAGDWSEEEDEIIRRYYPDNGPKGVALHLTEVKRSLAAISMHAHKLGVACNLRAQAPTFRMTQAEIRSAQALHDAGESYTAIAKKLGYAATTVSNALIIEEGKRRGYTPLPRDEFGGLTPDSLAKLREMLRKGMKGVDIQMRAGVSAACVAEQRRRYSAYLRRTRKVPLPQPGNGERYSGAKLAKENVRAAEALFMEGFGQLKIVERTGLSKTSVARIRIKLVRRLRRKKIALPGCELDSTRRRQKESLRFVPEEAKAKLRALLMERVPVLRAAKLSGIGTCTAYKLRDELKAELEERGETLPKPKLPGRVRGKHPEIRALEEWMPEGAAGIYHYRALVKAHGEEEARRILKAEKEEARAAQAKKTPRVLSFEEQLERVRRGAGLAPAFKPKRADPDFTLGGVATGAL